MPKRKYQRIPSSILIDLYETTSAVPKGRGCIVDVSLGGLAIETEASLPIGDELFLRIFFHDRSRVPIELFARVMRFQAAGNLYHYGMKYTRVGFFGRFKLRKTINALIAESLLAQQTAG